METDGGGWIQDTAGGVVLLIRALPRSGATRLAGIRDGRLLVRLAAAPVDDAANEALISLLSEIFAVPARDITILSGHHSRNKRVRVSNVTAQHAATAVAPFTSPPAERS